LTWIVVLVAAVAGPAPLNQALVTSPQVLAKLALGGQDAGAHLGAPGAASNRELLARSPWYASLVEVLRRDLASLEQADPRAGIGMQHAHRMFDPGWLGDSRLGFDLVGVVNRADRQPFSPEHCGETRLVYRLAYRTEVQGSPVRSRLPMTLNVVYWQGDPRPGTGCTEVWDAWQEGVEVALARRGNLKSVETNLQTVRWPSAVHPTMGGHAEYLLRVFRPTRDGRRLEPGPLENTPDVGRVRRDRALRGALLAWLGDPANLAAIDRGTAVVPERFLATRAISVAPRGTRRLANRPFSQILEPRELEGLELRALKTVKSVHSLLRRLDTSSCQGCHQSRSVAGFHLLGDGAAHAADQLAVGVSPHLEQELERRRGWLSGEGREAVRPLSEAGTGSYGDRCGRVPGFEALVCQPGLVCRGIDPADDLGVCLAPEPGLGDPCEPGTVTARADPHRDRVKPAGVLACGVGQVCERTRVGFPDGMCANPGCEGLGEGEVCGAIALLEPFNLCVARGEPFERCVREHSRPAGLRSCGPGRPCRDDYVCAAVPAGGACIPPYFLFQLRVDGHPL
jgi:hypothetical protein